MYNLKASLNINVNGTYMQIPDPLPIENFNESNFYTWLVIVFAMYAPKNTIFTTPEYHNVLQLLKMIQLGKLESLTIPIVGSDEFIYIQ